MTNWKERYRAFCEWQRTPYQVPPLSTEHHCCSTCGTSYQGNFCPCCGLSARIGRYSLQKALMHLLEVWGFGNRSLFRTLRDLLLRPGYMVRDYLRGMQAAYYPPFNMFFLLATISVFISIWGINIKGERQRTATETFSATMEKAKQAWDTTGHNEDDMRVYYAIMNQVSAVQKFYATYPHVVPFFVLVISSVFFFLFFRHGPAYPDLHFSELLVTMVYSSNMITLYTIVEKLLCINDVQAVSFLTQQLLFIPMMQLSGYGWFRSLASTLLAYFLAKFTFFILAILYGCLVAAITL